MTAADDWIIPAQAYVPGRTERPAEGVYDPIRETAQAGMTAEALARSAAFRHGLLYIESGFYWEAHEVLEPVWMALPEHSTERRFVQALIQTANGLLKLCMERPKAALRLCGIARGLLPQDQEVLVLGQSAGWVHGLIASLEKQAKCAL